MILSVSTSCRRRLSIDRMAKELSRTWDTVLRKNVWINFNFENFFQRWQLSQEVSDRANKQWLYPESWKTILISERVIKMNSAKSLIDFSADSVTLKVIFSRSSLLLSLEIQQYVKANNPSAQSAPCRLAPWGNCLTSPLVVTPLIEASTKLTKYSFIRK